MIYSRVLDPQALKVKAFKKYLIIQYINSVSTRMFQYVLFAAELFGNCSL